MIYFNECFGWELQSVKGTQLVFVRESLNPVYKMLIANEGKYNKLRLRKEEIEKELEDLTSKKAKKVKRKKKAEREQYLISLKEEIANSEFEMKRILDESRNLFYF